MVHHEKSYRYFLIVYVILVLMLSVRVFGSTFVQGPALIEQPTSTTTAATTTTLTSASETNQMFTGSTTQTVVLPDATTLPVGRRFYITNRSSGIVTVNYNGGTLAKTLQSDSQATFILKSNGSNAGTWDISNTIVDLTTGVVGILPIANGGTNSGTALLNNLAVISMGGALVESSTSSTELGYLIGATSNVQTQINGLAPAGNYITSLTGDVTASGPGAAAATVTRINGTSLAGLGTGILKNTTGTGVPSIAIAADFPTLNQNTTGNAATVTTNANMTGDVTSVGNATTYNGVVPLNKGGTGQITKAAAFDALSPMTTGGDIIYGGASGTGTRLANGTAGQFLKSNGTTLAPTWAAASLDTQGQSEGSPVSTLTLKSPYNQLTTIGTATRLFETGYNNLLDNADFENIVSTTSWTAGTGVTPTLDTSNAYSNKQAVSLALSSTNGLVWYQDVTPTIKMAGQPFEFGMWVINTALTNLQLCARNAGATVGTCQAVPVNPFYQYVVLNLSAPSSGSVGVSLFTTGSATGTVVVDNAYVGYARNLSQVSQAIIAGQSSFVKTTSCLWSRTNTAMGDFSTTSACPGPTIESSNLGTWLTTDTDLPQQTINNLPPGDYEMDVLLYGYGSSSLAQNQYAVNDGTTTALAQPSVQPAAANNESMVIIPAKFTYSGAGNRTFKLQCAASAGSCNIDNQVQATVFLLKYFPSQSQTALAANTPSSPTIQTFTSGSGTYTKPNGVTYIKVRMVGAGGGGAGSGTASAGNGGNGGNTTFGTSLLSALGGSGAVAGVASQSGGAGGTSSLGTGPQGTALMGGMGGGSSTTTTYTVGGSGGANPLGGGGGAGKAIGAGQAGITNTGAGGGGGGSDTLPGTGTGAGGGAGGYVEALISNPLSTYSYAVGTAGTAGSAGTNGFAGGAGGSGYIEVTEYYGAQNVPLLIGSVVYSSTVQAGTSAGVTGVNYGTYTPTLTNTTNISASTAQITNYSVVGNQVQVSGTANITCSSAGGTSTALGISLPVASNFSVVYDLAGTMTSSGILETGALFADTTNKRATLALACQVTGDQAVRFTFGYTVK